MKTRNDAYNLLLQNGWTIAEIMEAFCEDRFPRMTINGVHTKMLSPLISQVKYRYDRLQKEDFLESRKD